MLRRELTRNGSNANAAAPTPNLDLNFAAMAVNSASIQDGRANRWWNTFRGGVAEPDVFFNSDGSPAYAPHNLFTWSEDLTNVSWGKQSSTTVTSGFLSPLGGLNAFRVVPVSNGTTNGLFRSGVMFAGGTLSFYAKAGEISSLTGQAGGGDTFVFDLSAGTCSADARFAGIGMIPLPNGWYRCWLRYGVNNGGGFFLNANSGANGTNGFLFWGTQVNIGELTSYVSTTFVVCPAQPAYGPHNILLRSEELDNATWTKTRATVTANGATAPNGTSTADILVEDTTASNTHTVAQAVPLIALNTPYTLSARVKAAGRTAVRLRVTTSTDSFIGDYDLVTGTVTGTSVVGTGTALFAAIENIGNGWFLISLTGRLAAGTSPQVDLFLRNNVGTTFPSYTGDGVSGVQVWGFALTQGALHQTYVPTTSAVVWSVTPRITYSRNSLATMIGPDGLVRWAPHNLFLWSQDFANAAWSKTTGFAANSAVLANQATAPDGTQSATLLYPLATGAAAYMTQNATAGGRTSLTVFAKAQNKSVIFLYGQTSSAYGSYYVNLANGATQVIGGSTDTATLSALPIGNGWYRVCVTWTNFIATSAPLGIGVCDAMGSLAITANGTDGVLVWGAQLNQGPLQPYYPTGSSAYFGPRFVYDPASVTVSESYGANLVTNGTFDANIAGWSQVNANATAVASGGEFVLTAGAGGSGGYTQDIPVIAGRTYQITVTGRKTSGSDAVRAQAWDGASFTTQLATVLDLSTVASAVTQTRLVTPSTGTLRVYLFAATSTAGVFDNVIVREFLGTVTTGTPAAQGLLVEEQRTNLLLWSQNFNNAAWSAGSGSFTPNAASAPDGTITASRFVPSATNSAKLITNQFITTSAISYVFSLRVKPDGYSKIGFREDALSGAAVAFDLTGAGSVLFSTNGTGTVTALPNGWYQINVVFTAFAGTSRPALYVLDPTYTTGTFFSVAWTPNGTSGLLLWGAQFEAGSFPTTYIPTTSASVTRQADSAQMTGTDFSRWWNAGGGSLSVSFQRPPTFGISGLGSQYICGAPLAIPQFTAVNGFVSVFDGTGAINSASPATAGLNRFALSYGTGSTTVVLNGELGSTVARDALGAGITTLTIGANSGGAAPSNTPISRIAYYNRALSSTQLQRLST